LKNRNDINEYAKEFDYKDEIELKKLDHKNRGKNHRKDKCLNLNLKTNVATMLTPNDKFKVTVRALGLPFGFAEYLEKQSERMNKLFSKKATQIEQ
jgi:hypothetical protein